MTQAEIEFGAFYPQNLTAGGNNFNNFAEGIAARVKIRGGRALY